MFEAYFIYTTLFIVLLSLSYVAYLCNNRQDCILQDRKRFINNIFVFIILFYTIVLGLRKNVGIDYESYYNVFMKYELYGNLSNYDIIFQVFAPLIVKYGFHYNFFIAFLAFVLIYSLINAFKNKLSLLYIYIFYFFTGLIMLSSVNIMRQYGAYFLVFYSFSSFFSKKYTKFAILFFIAFTLHKSCIVYIPFLFFKDFDIFRSKSLQYILLFTSFFVGEFVFQYILNNDLMDSLTPYLGDSDYTAYTNSYNFTKMSRTSKDVVNTGLYKYFLLILDTCIIFYSSRLKHLYLKYNIIFFYNLYLFGIIFQNIFSFNEVTSRIFIYFEYYRFYILSILTYDCFKVQKCNTVLKVFFWTVFALLVVFFYRTIGSGSGGCAPWQFI